MPSRNKMLASILIIIHLHHQCGWKHLKLGRSTVEQKKADETKELGAIDYDAPTETEEKTIGLGTKV